MILRTARLELRDLTADDAAFVLALLNEPSFINNVGDRGVRTLDDARAYIASGPVASYERYGFGLYCVGLRENGEPIGICGLLRRDVLPDPDLGFAFLPAYWKRGYARESAGAVRDYARKTLGIDRLLAITDPENDASIRVLTALGFRRAGTTRLSGAAPELTLFAYNGELAG